MFKYLEPLKKANFDDTSTVALITKAYEYYQFRVIPDLNEQQKDNAQYFSCFVRFFKCINSSRKIDEEFLQNYFKNEVFKGKPQSIATLNAYIEEIKAIQKTRLMFNSEDGQNSLQAISNKNNSKGPNIKEIINCEYKIDVVISNDYSNKMLTPEIYLLFTLDDGSTLKTKIDLRMFNELRKGVALNIKKILENENVPLLK